MAAYLARVQEALDQFDYYAIYYIPRDHNQKVDSLAKLASTGEAQQMGLVPVETLSSPSIDQIKTSDVFETSPCRESWMTPYRSYIENGILPKHRNEKRKILRKASRFIIQDGIMYRKGYSVPLLRCIAHDEVKRVLHDVHEGECGDHTGGQALAKKILRHGYYWPTVNRDAANYARKCDKCQKHARIPRAPPTEITQMVSPWPFAVWGIDIIGSLPLAKGGAKYTIVAVDYFTKWAEAEPLATITTKKVINFVVRNIICQFGLPHTIITDNGTQFDSAEFKDFCKRFHIQKKFSAVAHPQPNGQVEAVNKVIKSILKKRLEKVRGKWVDELPMALWAYL